MAIKDYLRQYVALTGEIPNSVSRDDHERERSISTVVIQSGKMILDSELQLAQESLRWELDQLRQWEGPSGWLRGQSRYDALGDWVTGVAPVALWGHDNSGSAISIVSNSLLVPGDSITIGASILTAISTVPIVGSANFQIGATAIATAGNIATTINGYAPLTGLVTANQAGDGANNDVQVLSVALGTYTTTISLTTSNAGSIVLRQPPPVYLAAPQDLTHGILDPATKTMINGVVLPRLVAMVAGRPVVVEYTNCPVPGYNLISLQPPTPNGGPPPTVKRTDFLFLEVWYALIAPSLQAAGTITIASTPNPGDTVTVAGVIFTAGTDFAISGTTGTAANLAAAVAGHLWTDITAFLQSAGSNIVVVQAIPSGAVGNSITLASSTGAMLVSGATLTGGADRPGKPNSNQGTLYRHGNTLSPPNVWLPDEIIDPTVKQETTQRVQLQYRIRVTGDYDGVNYKTHPDGFSNTVQPIVAQGGASGPVASYPFVRADTVSTNGNSNAVAYGIDDPGLWIAGGGLGSDATALGTVDGYVYAIPIGFIHRHDDVFNVGMATPGFDPQTNANGAVVFGQTGFTGYLGTIPAGKSDRPDGHFADVIDPSNILDLRRHIVLSGLDLSSEIQFQIQSLLDGNNHTWSVDTDDLGLPGTTGGDVSTQYLVCDVIERLTDTPPANPMGNAIRSFDHVARRFGSQSVVERLVVAFLSDDTYAGRTVTKSPDAAIGGWHEGDTLTLDLTALLATTDGTVFDGNATPVAFPGAPAATIASLLPTGAVITDVLSAYHDDGDFTTAIDQTVQIAQTFGLGTNVLQISLDANPQLANGGVSGNPTYALVDSSSPQTVASSTRRIFLEVEIMYPLGAGATCSPDLPVTPDATVYNGTISNAGTHQGPGVGASVISDVTEQPQDLSAAQAPQFRTGYREIQLEYVTDQINYDTTISRNRHDVYTPRRANGAIAATIQDLGTGTPPAVVADPASEYGSSSRHLVNTAALTGLGQTLCKVVYNAQDAIPSAGVTNNGYRVAVYYRANAPQTAGVVAGALGTVTGGVLPTILNVEPLKVNPALYTALTGAGSVDLAYPYARPLDQIAVNPGTGPTIPEWFFCASAGVAISDFDANTGMLSLHTLVEMDAQNVLQFGSNSVPPVADDDFRAMYTFALDSVYRPVIMAKPLSGASRHKVFVPFLARIVEDTPSSSGDGILFRKNEVVLVVLSRFAALDGDNTVQFENAATNTSAASVYRTRNLLMISSLDGAPNIS